jgi:hypothetical protein
MKKFRALLLSMVMFTSVCPLYGFAPTKAVAQDGGDEPAVEVTPEEAGKAVEKAIDSVDKATDIEIVNVNALEQDALDNLAGSEEREMTGVDALLEEINNLKNGTEGNLEAAYGDVLTEGFKVLDAINKASQDNQNATFAANWADYWYDQTKAARNRKEAFKDAGYAENAADYAKEVAKDAREQAGNANTAVNTAKDIIKSAEEEVKATNKAIDDKLDQAKSQAKTAMEDTAKAAEEAEAVKDTIEPAANVADTLATAAKTNLVSAHGNFVEAMGNLLGSIFYPVRPIAQNVAAKGVKADMVQNVENKNVDTEGVAKANADLKGANEGRHVYVETVVDNVEAVRTAGKTLARNYIVNEITTAVKDLLNTADVQAKEDYAKAETAATDAAAAYDKVNVIDAESLHVNESDLNDAKELAADMGTLAERTKQIARSASRQAKAAGNSAEKAEKAARRKRGR